MGGSKHKFVAEQVTTSCDGRGKRRLEALLLRVVDGSLAGCIFVVPFLLGGQHPLGRLMLVVLAVAAALGWTVRQVLKPTAPWRWSGVEVLLAAGAALLVLQMTPLSPQSLKALSPHTTEILPLWNPDVPSSIQLGAWSTVSLAPAETRAALVMFLVYSLLFVVAVQRIRATEDVERLLRWIALSAALTAAFGLVQLFTSNGKYFWFYHAPFSHTLKTAKAAFGNRNHFAHYLALGIGPLIWWLQDGLRRRSKRQLDPFALEGPPQQGLSLGTTLHMLALGTVVFAVLLSLSRGGILVASVAAGIAVVVCHRARLGKLPFTAALAAVALLVAVSLAIFGLDRVSSRIDSLMSMSINALDDAKSRRTVWEATFKAARDHWLVGSGLGSFREVVPMYLESIDGETYYGHAENGYLQVALESGVAGFGLLIVGLACCGFWCLGGLWSSQSKRTAACLGAVAAGLAASALHSAADFVWYNPACMAVAVILAACACRLRRFSVAPSGLATAERSPPRPVMAVGAVVLAVVGAWMIRDRIGPALVEERLVRFHLLRRTTEEFTGIAGKAIAGGEAGPGQVSLAAEERMKGELEHVLARCPDHARAHLELAACCLRLFECCQQDAVNMMSLGQIRDAAIASRFPSRQALDDWLERAVGEHRTYLDVALEHTRQAVTLCPVLGQGYLYLSNLCFLENGDVSTQAAYLEQALRVRPFDGMVLFHAGKEAWLAGDEQRWLDCWRRAFRCGEVYQRQIIDGLAGRARPEDLDQEIRFFLEVFEPDLAALAYLDQRYRQFARPEQTLALRMCYARALEAEAESCGVATATELWVKAASLYDESADYGRAVAAARKAVASQPSDYGAHWILAHCLYQSRRFAEAEQELAWCLNRHPADEKLNAMYRNVVKRRIDEQIRTAEAGQPGGTLK